MKHIIFFSLITTIIAACASPAPVQPTVDIGAIQTAAVQTAQGVVVPTQALPTDTSLPPTDTAIPPTEAAPAAGAGNTHFAWNFIGSQESGGLKVEIARFVLADKSTVPMDFTMNGFTKVFDDRPVVAEIIFKITNTTDQKISIFPDQGKVIGGGEQIELLDFFLASFGDTISGEIFPGVTVIGGIWFGFKRTPVDQITSVTIAFTGPSNENFASLGPDFNIVLDLTNRKDEPLPDELK